MRKLILFCVIIITVIAFNCDNCRCADNKAKGKSTVVNDKSKEKKAVVVQDKCKVKAKKSCSNSCSKDSCKTKCGKFVDKDGDGINDNRCSGMGISKNKRHGSVIKNDSLTTKKPKKK